MSVQSTTIPSISPARQARNEERDAFFHNVQLMLLNFFNHGIPLQDVMKHYKMIFSSEPLPNPQDHGYKDYTTLLRSKYAKPYFIILAYNGGDAKPDLIKAKNLNISSYFMLKKGRDLVRIVRRSAVLPSSSQVNTPNNLDSDGPSPYNDTNNMNEAMENSTVKTDSWLTRADESDAVKWTKQLPNTDFNVEITKRRIPFVQAPDKEIFEAEASGHDEKRQKISIKQWLSTDITQKEFSTEEYEEYPPDQFLKDRSHYSVPRSTIFSKPVDVIGYHHSQEQLDIDMSKQNGLLTRDFNSLFKRRPRLSKP